MYVSRADEWQREVPGTMTAEEVLVNSISFFNKELAARNLRVQLKDKSTLYRLHIAKKNGLPKDDLPRTLDRAMSLALDRKQQVMEIGFPKFALSYSEDAISFESSPAPYQPPTPAPNVQGPQADPAPAGTRQAPKPVPPAADEKKCCCSLQ